MRTSTSFYLCSFSSFSFLFPSTLISSFLHSFVFPLPLLMLSLLWTYYNTCSCPLLPLCTHLLLPLFFYLFSLPFYCSCLSFSLNFTVCYWSTSFKGVQFTETLSKINTYSDQHKTKGRHQRMRRYQILNSLKKK